MVTTLDLSPFVIHTLDEDIHHKPGNDLAAVPHHVSSFAGVPFKVRGLIQLSSAISKEKTTIDYPSEVLGIPVRAAGAYVHFLQCSSWHAERGTVVGEYRVHYADGQADTIPIVYGHSVIDWWFMDGDDLPTDAAVAWRGDNASTMGLGHVVQLHRFTWANPRPTVVIDSIDFVSLQQESAPFLMAVTGSDDAASS